MQSLTSDGVLEFIGGQGAYVGGYLQLFSKNNQALPGGFQLSAINDTEGGGHNIDTLRGEPDGSLTWIINGTLTDLAGSAIVGKSVNENGYITYASGLIIQWRQDGQWDDGPTSLNENYDSWSGYCYQYVFNIECTGFGIWLTVHNHQPYNYAMPMTCDNDSVTYSGTQIRFTQSFNGLSEKWPSNTYVRSLVLGYR